MKLNEATLLKLKENHIRRNIQREVDRSGQLIFPDSIGWPITTVSHRCGGCFSWRQCQNDDCRK